MAEDAGEVLGSNLETQAISFLLDVKSNAAEALQKLDVALDSSEQRINKRLDRLAEAINENANRQNAIFFRQAEGIEQAVKSIEKLGETLASRLPAGSEAAEHFAAKAVPALDKTKSKMAEVGAEASKMADKTKAAADKAGLSLEGLWNKIKKLDVRNTFLGGLAVGAAVHTFREADETYKAATVAPKLTQMTEAAVNQRRTDIGATRIKTGATLAELTEINSALSAVEHRGRFAFQPAAESAIEFSRATGLAMKSSAELYGVLKNTYNFTHEQSKAQMENMAFLAKNSNLSVDNYARLADELKYVKYGLDSAAGSSEKLLKSSMEAAATMSRYGFTAEDTARQVKDLTEGGMDEYMNMMQLGIMGGADAQEVMDAIASGDQKRLSQLKAAGVSSMMDMAGPGVGQFAMRDNLKKMGLSGAEVNKFNAMGKGVEENQPGAINQAAGPEDREKLMLDTMHEYETVSELYARQFERANGVLAASQEGLYDSLHRGAVELEHAAASLGASFNNTSASTKNMLGMIFDLVTALAALKALGIGKLFGKLPKLGLGKLFAKGAVAEEVADIGKTLAVQSPGWFEKLGAGIKNALGIGSKAALADMAATMPIAADTIAVKTTATFLSRFAPLGVGLKTIFSTGFQAALGASMIIFNSINDKLDEWAEKSETFRKHWYGFWDQYGEQAEAALSLVSEGYDIIKKKAAEVWKSSTGGLKTHFQTATEEIKKDFVQMVDVLKALWDDLWDKMTPKWLGGKHKVEEQPKGQPAGIPRGLGDQKDVAAAAAAGVEQGAGKATLPEAAKVVPAPVTGKATLPEAAKAAGPTAPEKAPAVYPKTLSGLETLAKDQGMHVTATTGGEHNPGSLHYKGQAMDVRTNGEDTNKITAFMAAAKASGFNVLDERNRQPGKWSGPHIHVSYGVEAAGGAMATKGGQAAAMKTATAEVAKGPTTSSPMAVAATTPMPKAGPQVASVSSASAGAVTTTVGKEAQDHAFDRKSNAATITEGDTLLAGELRRIQGILAEHTRLLARGMSQGSNSKPFTTAARSHNELGNGG